MPDDDGEALAPLDALLRWVATPEERAAIDAWFDPELTPGTIQSFANFKDGKKKNYPSEREWPREHARVYREPESVEPIYDKARAALKSACTALNTLLESGDSGGWSFQVKARRLVVCAAVEKLPPTLFLDFRFDAELVLPRPYGFCTSLSGPPNEVWALREKAQKAYATSPRINGPHLVRVNPRRQRECFHHLWHQDSLVVCRIRTKGAAAAAGSEGSGIAATTAAGGPAYVQSAPPDSNTKSGGMRKRPPGKHEKADELTLQQIEARLTSGQAKTPTEAMRAIWTEAKNKTANETDQKRILSKLSKRGDGRSGNSDNSDNSDRSEKPSDRSA